MGDTFDDTGAAAAEQGSRRITQLIVLLECDRPLAGGARYSLDGIGRVVIGRGDARGATRQDDAGVKTLVLRLPGRSLSGTHARLLRVGASWAIEDLASKNGTFVQGKRVERAVLGRDDVFEVGHSFLRVNDSVLVPAGDSIDLDLEAISADSQATLDPAFRTELHTTARIAASNVPVLILGESGTGKEVMARWVHRISHRSGELVGLNCGAIPAALVESTLFGHVKGAFSGALRDEPGYVRAAHGGSLFLDEIAALPRSSQAALLRVLQEREVVPVGSTRPVAVDVRVIAATHEPLEEMVAEGAFRRDLFARIAGFTLRLPPLRNRRDDLGVLVAALLRKIGAASASHVAFSPEAGLALLGYQWPLNIRELEQCLSTSVSLAESGRIEPRHLPGPVLRGPVEPSRGAPDPARGMSARDQGLRLELLAELARHKGNLAEVARAMGKARMQVHRWCRRFGVDPNVYRK
ncbi:MAG: sigma 54-interacting transcriptional regulator [Myxococcales bacterium]|nr:sigma 54-interacting transcriptional regulator [Myxococcales bacterium]